VYNVITGLAVTGAHNVGHNYNKHPMLHRVRNADRTIAMQCTGRTDLGAYSQYLSIISPISAISWFHPT